MRQKKSLVTVGELVSLLSRRAEGLKAAGRHSSAMHAVAAQRSIEKYAKESGRGEERLCGETLRRYEAWLTDKGVCPNTTSFYMRTLRSALSASGHDIGIFREVYTGVAPTDKIALTRKELRQLSRARIADKSAETARDIFLFSFLTRGIPPIDMALLGERDLHGNRLTYVRRKTRKRMQVVLPSLAVDILKRLRRQTPGESKRLLPILRDDDRSETACKVALARINRNLRKACAEAGLDRAVSLYAARHTWASLANAKGVPLAIISRGLGHSRLTTTLIYLSEMSENEVDAANMELVRDLKLG